MNWRKVLPSFLTAAMILTLMPATVLATEKIKPDAGVETTALDGEMDETADLTVSFVSEYDDSSFRIFVDNEEEINPYVQAERNKPFTFKLSPALGYKIVKVSYSGGEAQESRVLTAKKGSYTIPAANMIEDLEVAVVTEQIIPTSVQIGKVRSGQTLSLKPNRTQIVEVKGNVSGFDPQYMAFSVWDEEGEETCPNIEIISVEPTAKGTLKVTLQTGENTVDQALLRVEYTDLRAGEYRGVGTFPIKLISPIAAKVPKVSVVGATDRYVDLVITAPKKLPVLPPDRAYYYEVIADAVATEADPLDMNMKETTAILVKVDNKASERVRLDLTDDIYSKGAKQAYKLSVRLIDALEDPEICPVNAGNVKKINVTTKPAAFEKKLKVSKPAKTIKRGTVVTAGTLSWSKDTTYRSIESIRILRKESGEEVDPVEMRVALASALKTLDPEDDKLLMFDYSKLSSLKDDTILIDATWAIGGEYILEITPVSDPDEETAHPVEYAFKVTEPNQYTLKLNLVNPDWKVDPRITIATKEDGTPDFSRCLKGKTASYFKNPLSGARSVASYSYSIPNGAIVYADPTMDHEDEFVGGISEFEAARDEDGDIQYFILIMDNNKNCMLNNHYKKKVCILSQLWICTPYGQHTLIGKEKGEEYANEFVTMTMKDAVSKEEKQLILCGDFNEKEIANAYKRPAQDGEPVVEWTVDFKERDGYEWNGIKIEFTSFDGRYEEVLNRNQIMSGGVGENYASNIQGEMITAYSWEYDDANDAVHFKYYLPYDGVICRAYVMNETASE